MHSIGDRLRKERLRRGLDIDQLAEQTKINAAMLEAIEADDLDRLPGSFFTRSFVRQYAKALELDDDEFEVELKRVTGADEPAPVELPMPSHDLGLAPITPGVTSRGPSRHSFGALAAFVLILAACTGIYTLWQRSRASAPAPSHRSAAAQPKKAPLPPPAQERVPSTPPAAVPGASGATGTQSGAPLVPSEAASPEQTPSAAPDTLPPIGSPESPASSLAPGETATIHVEVRTTGEAWISTAADGKGLFTGLLEPNVTRVFEGKERMSIRFGDPAAVEVTWNGKPVGTIGPQGKPRTVQFTPAAFRVLSPAPPTPEPPTNDGL